MSELNPRWKLWLDTKPEIVKPYKFSAWIMGRWSEWRKLRGVHPDAPTTTEMHADFDAWLEQSVTGIPASTRPLSAHPLCKHGERDYDELPHAVYSEMKHAWERCPAVSRG